MVANRSPTKMVALLTAYQVADKAGCTETFDISLSKESQEPLALKDVRNEEIIATSSTPEAFL